MSNDAAIAAVTATLTNMIQAAVSADSNVSSGTVTARPPDRARQGSTGNQVNLFLYRTSIDAAWRNQDPPAIHPGEIGQPPLPLVLSYLITAYGENDDEILAHRLLGIAMAVLHDKPVLPRSRIASALPAPGAGLENQVERVRITPDPRSLDEISRMWATFGTGYRLSVSYDAAVVLIDSTQAISAPLPVLMRGPGDTGPTVMLTPFPEIALVQPPNNQAAAQPGDVLTLTGTHLDAVTSVQVTHPLGPQPLVLDPLAGATPDELRVTLPDPPTLPAGVATVIATFDLSSSAPGGAPTTMTSNAAPVALAPTIVSGAQMQVTLAAAGATPLNLTCSPAVQPTQTIALIIGSQVVSLSPLAAATSQLSFNLEGLAAGTYTLRLRVDSVDSIPFAPVAPPVNPNQPAPMQFDPKQQVVLS